jgi:hypothetical protein
MLARHDVSPQFDAKNVRGPNETWYTSQHSTGGEVHPPSNRQADTEPRDT